MLHFITIKNLQEPNNVSIFASEKEKKLLDIIDALLTSNEPMNKHEGRVF